MNKRGYMKVLISLIALTLSGSIFASCPDFSGNYLQAPGSCHSNFSQHKRSLWPLVQQEQITNVEIKQNNCETIHIVYREPQYSNQPLKEVILNLTDAAKLEVSDGQMNIQYSEDKKRVSYFGHTLNSKEETNLMFHLDGDDQLIIKTHTKLRGTYDYFIPVRENFKSKCQLQKRN